MNWNVNLNQDTYKDIPEYVISSLERYIEHRTPPGSFVAAILENDLFTAIGRADTESLKALKGIVTLIHCHVRGDCWGNKENVKDWLKGS